MTPLGSVRVRSFFTLAVGLVACLALVSCGSAERNADAYCRAFYETAAPIREGYVEADEHMEEDPFGSVVTLLGSSGDMTVIFDTMAAHAPDEIRSDTEAARDALEDQQDALGDALSDPLGAIGSGVIAGITSSGSFARVDAYLDEHCPVDSEFAQEIISESK
jgi:hypothetical protein